METDLKQFFDNPIRFKIDYTQEPKPFEEVRKTPTQNFFVNIKDVTVIPLEEENTLDKLIWHYHDFWK